MLGSFWPPVSAALTKSSYTLGSNESEGTTMSSLRGSVTSASGSSTLGTGVLIAFCFCSFTAERISSFRWNIAWAALTFWALVSVFLFCKIWSKLSGPVLGVVCCPSVFRLSKNELKLSFRSYSKCAALGNWRTSFCSSSVNWVFSARIRSSSLGWLLGGVFK